MQLFCWYQKYIWIKEWRKSHKRNMWSWWLSFMRMWNQLMEHQAQCNCERHDVSQWTVVRDNGFRKFSISSLGRVALMMEKLTLQEGNRKTEEMDGTGKSLIRVCWNRGREEVNIGKWCRSRVLDSGEGEPFLWIQVKKIKVSAWSQKKVGGESWKWIETSTVNKTWLTWMDKGKSVRICYTRTFSGSVHCGGGTPPERSKKARIPKMRRMEWMQSKRNRTSGHD